MQLSDFLLHFNKYGMPFSVHQTNLSEHAHTLDFRISHNSTHNTFAEITIIFAQVPSHAPADHLFSNHSVQNAVSLFRLSDYVYLYTYSK